MRDELAIVLRLVAEGRLSPDDAAPLIEALNRPSDGGATLSPGPAPNRAEPGRPPPPPPPPSVNEPRQLRIRVSERGRQVVNLRIPLTFADTALRMVPGLSSEQGDRIRAAIAGKTMGPILDVEDEDGDGVVISME
jgi:hypothetical protein